MPTDAATATEAVVTALSDPAAQPPADDAPEVPVPDNAAESVPRGEQRDQINGLQHDWIAAAIERIETVKSYPAQARNAQITGTVLVRFQIDAYGRAMGIRLLSSSGNRALDQAALAAISAAAPFPPGARPLTGHGVLEVPVVFLLSS